MPLTSRSLSRLVVCTCLALLTDAAAEEVTDRPLPHEVFDFVARFSLAEVQTATTAIDFGTPAARHYLLTEHGALRI